MADVKLCALKTAHETIKKVNDPNNPEKWKSVQFEENTRTLADRTWPYDEVTPENPYTDYEGRKIPDGDYIMWHVQGSFVKAIGVGRKFWQDTYFDVNEIPDEDIDLAHQQTPETEYQTNQIA